MQPRPILHILTALVASGICLTLLLSGWLAIHTDESWPAVIAKVMNLSPYVLFFSLVCVIGLGLPAVAFLQSKNWLRALPCAIAGILAGVIPTAIFGIVFIIDAGKVDQNGAQLIANGLPTLTGLLVYAQLVAITGTIGLACGLTFWAALRAMTCESSST